jgi:tRNA/tmRNA/rRNA uracil-C5-methylase (TrmA/RlmC/RlmD family)
MLLPEVLNLTVKDLRAWYRDKAIPELTSCEVAMSPVDGSITFYWIFNKSKGNSGAARMIMDGVEEIAAGKETNIAGQAVHDSRGATIATRGRSLPLEAGGVRMWATPGTFFQVNPPINAVLVKRVLTHIRSKGATSLLDLYCGNGNFSLPAAATGMKTVGVESSSKAVHDALSASGPDSRFIEMDTARFLAEDNETRDAVIVDPPRTGLPREVVTMLGAKPFPTLIYVSCEPSTLARDLARLTGAGYVISHMELFDMFPQTSHSEALVVMKR